MAPVKITPEMATQAEEEAAALPIPSDAEIEAAVAADPDAAPILTGPVATAARVRWVRKATGLTQAAFADRYGIPLGTLRDWEQGKSTPDATARSYLRVIERDCEVVTVGSGAVDEVRFPPEGDAEVRFVMERTGATREAVLAAIRAHGPMRSAVMVALGSSISGRR